MVTAWMHGRSRVGREATIARLRSDLASPFSLLHIASHAVGGSASQPGPAIALSGASPSKSVEWLAASEVRRMHLRGRLVVLSACGSTSGDAYRGAMSLAEAFVLAGATEAVGARWAVDDSATLEFMRVFYGHLRHSRDTATALRNARGGFIGGTFLPYQNPHFWAAFTSLIADTFLVGQRTRARR
jgi:CHAT domain-containing protein